MTTLARASNNKNYMSYKDKEVRKKYNKEYRLKNKEKLQKKRKEWEEKNKDYLKEYHKEYHKEWYQRNKEKRQQQLKEYAKNHKEDAVKRVQKYVKKNKEKVYKYGQVYNQTISGSYRTYRNRAKKLNMVFDLTIEEFAQLVTDRCKYCGEVDKKRGVDRVNNKKGYTTNNTEACCTTCNFMKRTATVKEFLEHIKKIAKHNGI